MRFVRTLISLMDMVCIPKDPGAWKVARVFLAAWYPDHLALLEVGMIHVIATCWIVNWAIVEWAIPCQVPEQHEDDGVAVSDHAGSGSDEALDEADMPVDEPDDAEEDLVLAADAEEELVREADEVDEEEDAAVVLPSMSATGSHAIGSDEVGEGHELRVEGAGTPEQLVPEELPPTQPSPLHGVVAGFGLIDPSTMDTLVMPSTPPVPVESDAQPSYADWPKGSLVTPPSTVKKESSTDDLDDLNAEIAKLEFLCCLTICSLGLWDFSYL